MGSASFDGASDFLFSRTAISLGIGLVQDINKITRIRYSYTLVTREIDIRIKIYPSTVTNPTGPPNTGVGGF